jgi:anti-sigma B factor antagonist
MAARSKLFHHPRGEGSGLTVSVGRAEPAHVRLCVTGELDLASAKAFATCVEGQIAEGRRQVHLDLAGVSFVDATGLSVLVQAHQRLLELRGSLILDVLSGQCRRLIEMVGLHHTLLISDQPAGIKSFSAEGRTDMVMGISAR